MWVSADGLYERALLPVDDCVSRSTRGGSTVHWRLSGASTGTPSGGVATPKSRTLSDGDCLRRASAPIDTAGRAPALTTYLTYASSVSPLGLAARTPNAYSPGVRVPPSKSHSQSLAGGSTPHAPPVPSKVRMLAYEGLSVALYGTQAQTKLIRAPQTPLISHEAAGSSGSDDEHASSVKSSVSPTLRSPPSMCARSGSFRSVSCVSYAPHTSGCARMQPVARIV